MIGLCRRLRDLVSARRGGPRISAARLAAAVSVTIGALLAFSGVALAHAAFVRSQPAPGVVLQEPPTSVTIWFTEPVAPSVSQLDVLDHMGTAQNVVHATALPGDPKALTVPLPPIGEGTYTVVWKSFSAVDGHSANDYFTFVVGEPSPVLHFTLTPHGPELASRPTPVDIAVRWLGLLGVLSIIGYLVFELFITRPVLAAEGSGQNIQDMDQHMESRTLTLIWLSIGAVFAAAVGELLTKALVASASAQAQTLPSKISAIIRTDWGSFWQWRVVFLLAAVVVLAMVTIDRRSHRLSGRREWQMVLLPLAAAILFTTSMTSHGAAATEIRQAAIFSDYVHMLGAAIWVGGLIYIALVVPRAMKMELKRMRGEQSSGLQISNVALLCPSSHVKAMSRFAALAILSVGALLITGLYASWAQVGSFPALLTPYGATLLVKLGLVAIVVGFGAFNFLRIRPRLDRDGDSLQLLRKTVAVQALTAVVLLLSVGLLVNLEPARQVAAHNHAGEDPEGLVMEEKAEGVTTKMVISPGTLGVNQVTVLLTDQSGKAVTDAKVVTLQVAYADKDIGSSTDILVDGGSGLWVAYGIDFSLAGNWQTTVVVQRPGAFDARTEFKFQLPIQQTNATEDTSTGPGTVPLVGELALLGVLSGGVGLYVGGKNNRAGLAGLICGGVLILAAVVVGILPLLG